MMLAPVVALATLGACNDRGGGGSSTELDPGEWELTGRIVDASGDGIPPEAISQIKGQRFPAKTRCLTEEDAADPAAKLLRQSGNSECSLRDIEWEDGRIRGELSCESDEGMRMNVDMNGEYGAEDFEIDLEGEMTVPQLQQPITIRMAMEGRRKGECRGDSRDRDER
jgi:hypothetical protein